MARKKTLQTNFSSGEIAPDVGMRQDIDQYQNGAKSLRNRRCLIGGGTKRRPGSLWLAILLGPCRIEDWVVNQSTTYIVVFTAGRMDAYLEDGTPSGAAVGPWTGTIWQTMDFVQSGNTMFLTHVDMPPQVITRTGAAAFACGNFGFASGPAGRPEQPYLKFVSPAVTILPTALTGTGTIIANASVFVPGHVGTFMRYLGKAMQVTAFNSAANLSVSIVEALPGTFRLTVTGSAGFATEEIVAGLTSGARGLVTAIVDATHIEVVLTRGVIQFTTESLVGPNAATAISAISPVTPAAIPDWDEQMFSAVRGYPSCVELHRNRLLFGGHKSAPSYLIGSSLTDISDFNVGDGSDADAILESIGDASAAQIVQLHSAEQLLIATDHGFYYCPESQANPFRPSSIAFFPFGSPWPITATAKMQPFDNGVLALSGSTIVKARPTGDLTNSWSADEVSLLSHHLIETPTEFAVVSNYGGGPERYAAVRNSDGTLVMLQLVEAQRIRNMTPWDANGTILSVAALGGTLYAAVSRVAVSASPIVILEKFDQDLTLDAATVYPNEAAMNAGVPARYGSAEVNVVVGRFHLGTYPPALDPLPVGPLTVGYYFDSVVETLPPVIDGQEGPQAGDRMRIVECYAHVIGSQRFSANGTALSAYQTGDDPNVEPPILNGPQRFQFLGWQREPTVTFNQPDPLPFDLLAIRSVVAF